MTHLSLFMLGFTVVLIANFISLTKAERRLVPTVLFKEVTDIRSKWLSGEYEDKDHHYEVLLEALAWYKNEYDRQRRRLGEINRANLMASFAESQEQDIVNAEVSVDGIRRMTESDAGFKEKAQAADIEAVGGEIITTSDVDKWTNDRFQDWVGDNSPDVITPIGDDEGIYFFVPLSEKEKILHHWRHHQPKNLVIPADYPYNEDQEKPSLFINGRHENFPLSKKSFPRDYQTVVKTMTELLPEYKWDGEVFNYYTDDGTGDHYNLWTVALSANEEKFNEEEGEPALKWARSYSDWTSRGFYRRTHEKQAAKELFGFITFFQFNERRTTKPMKFGQVDAFKQDEIKVQECAAQWFHIDATEVIARGETQVDGNKYDAHVHTPMSQKGQVFNIIRTYVIAHK